VPADSPPYHKVSSAAAWRGLLARGSLLRACSTRLAQLHDLSFIYASVGGAIKDLAKVAGVAQAAASDMVAVREAVGQWRSSIADWLNNPGTTATEERVLLEEIHELCMAATAENPFAAIFAPLCALSAEVYGEDCPKPELMLDDLLAHPRDPPDLYAVLAKVTPATPAAAPVVTLMIYPNGLGPATFAALPGLLAHECICHVPAKQDRVKNDSSFAEGFMDWAAQYFFDGSIAHLLPELSAAAKAHAGPFGELFASPRTQEGRARRLGRLAADHLVALTIEELGISDLEAAAIVARVARDLNRHQAPITAKDLLVAKILAVARPYGLLSEVLKGERPAADLI
jgi:hypothetical protein